MDVSRLGSRPLALVKKQDKDMMEQYLVIGESPGPVKLSKARQWRVATLSEFEFLHFVGADAQSALKKQSAHPCLRHRLRRATRTCPPRSPRRLNVSAGGQGDEWERVRSKVLRAVRRKIKAQGSALAGSSPGGVIALYAATSRWKIKGTGVGTTKAGSNLNDCIRRHLCRRY